MHPVEHRDQWRKATVIKKVGERSYLAQTEEGNIYRRNENFSKPLQRQVKNLITLVTSQVK